MTMLCNIDVLPAPEFASKPEAQSFDTIEVYVGSFRIADGKSISTFNERMFDRDMVDLNLYAFKSGGDRSVVCEAPNRWKQIGEEPQTLTVTAGIQEEGIIVDLGQHCVDSKLNKWVANFHYHGPIGKLGKYLSKAEALRQDYLNLKETVEYKAFIKFLKSKGYKEPEELEQIAIGFMPPNQAEGVSDDLKMMGISKNYARFVEALAKEYGVDPELLDKYILIHATGHRGEIDGTRKGERELESLIAEFFEKLAAKEASGPTQISRSSNTSNRSKYLEIARKIAGKRYDDVNKNYPSSLSDLFDSYMQIAIDEGLEGDEAVEYALKMMEEEAENQEGSEEGSEEKRNEDSDEEQDSDENPDEEGEGSDEDSDGENKDGNEESEEGSDDNSGED